TNPEPAPCGTSYTLREKSRRDKALFTMNTTDGAAFSNIWIVCVSSASSGTGGATGRVRTSGPTYAGPSGRPHSPCGEGCCACRTFAMKTQPTSEATSLGLCSAIICIWTYLAHAQCRLVRCRE